MYITYADYLRFGYEAIAEKDFARFLAGAAAFLDRQTFNRLRGRPLDDLHIFGLCELVELFFNEGQTAVTAFTNEGYSETYAVDKSGKSFINKASLIVECFFCDSAYRGV